MLVLKSSDYLTNDHRVILLVLLIDDLLLTIEMDRATHQDKRSVESVVEVVVLLLVQELVAGFDDIVVDALLFTLVVDGHVTKDSQTEDLNLLVVLWLHLLGDILLMKKSYKLRNGILSD